MITALSCQSKMEDPRHYQKGDIRKNTLDMQTVDLAQSDVKDPCAGYLCTIHVQHVIMVLSLRLNYLQPVAVKMLSCNLDYGVNPPPGCCK